MSTNQSGGWQINEYSLHIVSGTGLLSNKLGVAISEPGLITCEH